VSLETMIKRNELLLNFMSGKSYDKKELIKYFGEDRYEPILNCLNKMNSDQRKKVVKNIESDIDLCNNMLKKFDELEEKGIENFDTKLKNLIELIRRNKGKPMLIFSSYIATVNYLYKKLSKLKEIKEKINFIHGLAKKDKEKFVNDFENGKFDIIIATDVLSEAVNLPRAKIVINYDLPYNPVRLIQRDGRAIRITNPKKVEIFNFIPKAEIDKELEIYKKLNMRVNNILTFIGLDFAMWAIEENKIKQVNEEHRKKVIELVREYKEKLSQESPEKLIKHLIPTWSKEDVVLRKAIEKFLITEDLVKSIGVYKKPVYTILKSENGKEFFYLCFQRDKKVEQLGELQLGSLIKAKQLSEDDIKRIYSLVEESFLEKKKELLYAEIEESKIRKIIQLCKKLKIDYEKLRIREKIYTESEYKSILNKLEELEKVAPWEEEEKKREVISFIESMSIQSVEELEKGYRLLGFIKYVA
ncbi:MAG: helicase-related protein, partial [Candidatus Pacearchaeota archaeon]